MVAVPDDIPNTAPVEAFTIATEGVPMLHEPPEGVQVSVVLLPIHISNEPVMIPVVALEKSVTLMRSARSRSFFIRCILRSGIYFNTNGM